MAAGEAVELGHGKRVAFAPRGEGLDRRAARSMPLPVLGKSRGTGAVTSGPEATGWLAHREVPESFLGAACKQPQPNTLGLEVQQARHPQ